MTDGIETSAVGKSGTTGKAIAPFRQFLSDFAESRFALAALARDYGLDDPELADDIVTRLMALRVGR